MRSILNGFMRVNLATAAAVILVASSSAFGQYSERQQITAVQQNVRTRILRENSGLAEAITFDNNAIVMAAEYGRMNRVTGSGRYRSNLSSWRVFNYEGLFNTRTGIVTNAMYSWSNDGPGNIRPPIGTGLITWGGRVDGTARITIQRGRVIAREIQTRTPIYQETSNVVQQLPQAAVNVRVSKRQGRGRVNVTQQPNRFNGFTATIEVSDPSGGSDYYALDIDWDNGGDYRPPIYPGPGGDRQMTWQGSVDDVLEIYVRDRTARYEVISGRNPTGVRFDFDGRLPRRAVNVSVRKLDGRGDVEVVRQPDRYNGYTAVVRITDRRGGADNYRFELDWDRNNEDEEMGDHSNLTWSGRVDDVVRLEIRGRSVRSYPMSGQALQNVRYYFYESLPSRAVNVSANRRDGRGDVRVIQQPNRFNRYTAIVEIRDTRGGADNYLLEINW